MQMRSSEMQHLLLKLVCEMLLSQCSMCFEMGHLPLQKCLQQQMPFACKRKLCRKMHCEKHAYVRPCKQ